MQVLSSSSILSAPEIPTVIFCGSDPYRHGSDEYPQRSRRQDPRGYLIIGIDDISFCLLARPPLTISVPRERLGITAFEH